MSGTTATTVAPAVSTGTVTALSGKGATSRSSRLLARYQGICYRLLGARVDSAGENAGLEMRLKQAGFHVTPGMYTALGTISSLLSTAFALVFSLAVFYWLIHPPYWWGYALLVTGVTGASVYGGFRFLLSSRIANRKDRLDRELPFTLSELSVLASTGVSPIRLVRRMAQRTHDPSMTAEFKRVIYKVDIQGKDLITAFAESARESPSPAVREAFWDIANMIHQGGNLDEYLRTKSDSVLQLKRLVQKEFIERLTTFLDMYVGLVLVGVLMIAVGAFLINSFGQTVGGLDANELLLVLTFVLVPLAVVATLVMISIAYARAE